MQIVFAPVVPIWLLVLLLPLLLLAVYAALPRWPARILASCGVLVCLLLLLNPARLREERAAVPDTLLLLRDTTLSNQLGERPASTEAAIAAVKQWAAAQNIEVREQSLTGSERAGVTPETSAVVVVGDGHHLEALAASGVPVSVLLTDDPARPDAAPRLLEAPGFGLVGQAPTVRIFLNEPGTLRVVSAAGAETQTLTAGEHSLTLPPLVAGANVFYLQQDTLPGEVIANNNAFSFVINGVRERLKVLLVSGFPHPGTRVWRDVLLRDPAVDLVHFTILRRPESVDAARRDELSLIPFPVDELFGARLRNFDIVILDQYNQRGLLADAYLYNIAEFSRNGGALLLVTGAEFSGSASLAASPLAAVLPLRPLQGAAVPQQLMRAGDIALAQPPLKLTARGAIPAALNNMSISVYTADEQQIIAVEDAKKPSGRVAHINSGGLWQSGRIPAEQQQYYALLQRLTQWLLRYPGTESSPARLTLSPEGLVASGVTLWTPSGSEAIEGGTITRVTPPPGVYAVTTSDGIVSGAVNWTDAKETNSIEIDIKAVEAVTDETGGTVKIMPQIVTDLPHSPRRHTRLLGQQQQAVLPPLLAACLGLSFFLLSWIVSLPQRRLR
ncbi:MAG: hypothetical protein ACK5XX_08355 [Holosporales bacterium]